MMPTTQTPGSFGEYDLLTTANLKSLMNFVRSRTKCESEAEDIFQDTLLLACRNIGQFRYESGVGTWLCCIALNVIRGRWRRRESSRLNFVETETLEWLAAADTKCSPLTDMVERESHRRLYGAIARLPLKYRVVVEMHDFQGLPLREVASRLTSTVPTVKSRHRRAKFMLLDRLMEKAA